MSADIFIAGKMWSIQGLPFDDLMDRATELAGDDTVAGQLFTSAKEVNCLDVDGRDQAVGARMATYLRAVALEWIEDLAESEDEDERAATVYHRLAELADAYLKEAE